MKKKNTIYTFKDKTKRENATNIKKKLSMVQCYKVYLVCYKRLCYTNANFSRYKCVIS